MKQLVALKFEPIKEEHIDIVREIYSYYIKNSTVTFHINEVSYEEMRQLVIFENPKYESYLIKQDDEICGYVVLTQFKPREAFGHSAEVTLYLKHGYEGRGIGRQALKFIEERARQSEKEINTLLALVCGENIGSRTLFERNGYAVCGEFKRVGYKFERWLDLITYQKFI